ncbi:MAG: hypothetical protein ACFFDN_29460 [Candidatus Hodarchaeota archaeon]
MKSKQKAILILLVLEIILVLSIISNTKFSDDQTNKVTNESDLNMTFDGLHSSDDSVIIYEHQNFGGASQILTEGTYNVDDLTIGDDKLSSLRVNYGFKVTLFEHPDFMGDIMIVTSDTPDVGTFNDKTSSIIVETETTINIITPEEKTYTEPMSGYYPATWGFENDEIGTVPEEWGDDSGTGCSVAVIEGLDNHKNVVELDDPTDQRRCTLYKSFSGHFFGTVEFYLRATSVGLYSEVSLSNEGTHLFRILFGSHYLRAYNNTELINFLSVNPHQWYHVRIDFRCQGAVEYMGLNEKEFKIYVDGQEYGPYIIFDNSDLGVNRMNIRTGIDQYNYRLYVDSIGFSWDADYNIGDNLNEGLLLSFEESVNLDWIGYSLDGQATITILGNTVFPVPDEGTHTIRVFGEDASNNPYKSQIVSFEIYYSGILQIHCPEDITYTGPMDGYHLATYGFENDESGKVPTNWDDYSNGNGYIKVINEKINYNGWKEKVLMIHSESITEDGIGRQIFEIPQVSGTIEWWMSSSDVLKHSYVRGYNDDWLNTFLIRFYDGQIQYYNGTDFLEAISATKNTWYHLRVEFDCNIDKYNLWINENQIDTSIDFNNPGDTLNYLIVKAQDITCDLYVDAIGYSWDSNYEIGDNLKEGLLLHFTSNIELKWMAYSLDGQANIPILGSTTIPMANNGPHSIQVFGKAKFGYYISDEANFTINQPLDGGVGGVPGDDDDDDDDDDEGIEFLGPTLIIIGTSLGIGVAGIAIYFVRKKRLNLKREK